MYTTKEEENNTMTKRQQEKLNALLTEIAKEELRLKLWKNAGVTTSISTMFRFGESKEHWREPTKQADNQ